MNTADTPADDPRLLDAVQAYLAELEAGRRPDRRALAARFPELADAMAPYLDALDAVHAAIGDRGQGSGVRSQESGVKSQAITRMGPAEGLPSSLTPDSRLLTPVALGDFRIVREIGRGGMGVVYEAVQLSLGRRVALKTLPFAAGLDARQLQRFKTEAQAAAQLHHSNIVPVYAVGADRGVHYYAMQLIDGRSLDAVIREARDGGGEATVNLRAGSTAVASAPPTGRNRDWYRTAARIAAQVADALAYAHDAGVVHRDIKPANLLLDAKRHVWVTDFGLAHVAADVGLTRTGDLLGTLRYMSPEQAAGRHLEIDHRTDVYSLGATLYELLTLEPVFPGQDRQTLLHQILGDDPRPPRAADRSVPAELETIVLKALAKAPGERYAGAAELAADLRRYLDERPILARRPTLVDRARKWTRRHPAWVGAAVLLLVFGVVGLAVSTVLVAAARERTQAALTAEQKRATEAEQRFQLARRSADDMVRIANDGLNDNPFEQDLRRRLLEAAAQYYQEFIDLRRDDPDAQAELAAARNQVQAILADLALLRRAWHHGLLMEPDVRADLRLRPDQVRRLDAVRDEMRGPDGDWPGVRFRPPTMKDVKAHEAAITATLTAPQLHRLRQIALQVRGPDAFRDPDVVAALGLTPEQRDRIRACDRLFFRDDRPHPGGRGDPRPRPWEDAVASILTVLSDDQRATWRVMTGDRFEGRVMPFFGPPGKGGPGGPRGPR